MPARFAILIACAAPTLLFADSYGPFGDYRQVDPTGRYYVVIKEAPGWGEDPGRGGPVTFAFAEQRPGSEPVTPEEPGYDWDKGVIPNPDIRVRDGDIRHGTGTLVRAPAQILISSTGLGFATLDVYGYNYANTHSGNSVIIVSTDGTIRHRKSLIDLFPENEISRFGQTAGGVFWWEGGWIDEQERNVVIVSAQPDEGDRKRLFRIVDWESGEVSAGSTDEILTALEDVNLGALPLAIELAIESNLRDAHRHLVPILDNEELSTSLRAYAAVALALFGDRRGVDLVKESAVTKVEDDVRVQRFAIRHLHELFGTDAARILREVVNQTGGDYEVRREFNEIGASAIPTLIDMVEDESDPYGQYLAAQCLGAFGSDAGDAVGALIEYATGTTLDEDDRWVIAIAFGEIGPPAKDAVPRLERWASDAQTELEQIEAVEAITMPGAFESQAFRPKYHLEHILEALRKIETVDESSPAQKRAGAASGILPD